MRALFLAVIVAALLIALSPPAASADDSAQISRLESEIQLLRTQIDAQHRRILRLEDELNRRAGGQPAPRIPEMRENRAATVATGPQPWHSPASWERVAQGMSESEVTSLLGEPDYFESLDELKTLFYQGLVNGTRTIRGHVNLRDGRVVAISKPEFDR